MGVIMTPNVKGTCFSVDQITELRQIEKTIIEAGGTGIKDQVQELIDRLSAGGIVKEKTKDPRIIQARRFWKKGWGRELGFKKFQQYLDTIPEIPLSLLADRPDLPLLVLVDPRLGIVKSCRLAGLKYEEYGWNDKTLEPYDDRHNIPTDKPYWIRASDGSPNLKRKPSDCRDECIGQLFAGTADVGIAIWIQYSPRGHVMDLPGSVHSGYRDHCAFVVPFGNPRLDADWSVDALPGCGSVVFVRE